MPILITIYVYTVSKESPPAFIIKSNAFFNPDYFCSCRFIEYQTRRNGHGTRKQPKSLIISHSEGKMITQKQLQELQDVAKHVRTSKIQTGRDYYTQEPKFCEFSTHFFNAEKLEIGYFINGTGTYYKGNTFHLGMTSLDPDSGFSPRKWCDLFWDDNIKFPFL